MTDIYPNISEESGINGTSFNGSVYSDGNYSDGALCRDDFVMRNRAIQALFYILYSTIFVLGVFGNVLVCYVVGNNKAMQTVTNFFITNLALSDILLCVLGVPFTPLYSFLCEWVFGKMLCHMVAYSQGTSVYISTLTLTSIAIDRFFVIIYPFKPRMKLKTCVLIIISIWIFSACATLPYGIFMNHTGYDRNGTNGSMVYYCEEAWPDESSRQIFGAFTASLQFVLPFVIITVCYVKVSLKLNDRARAKPGCKNSRKEEADRERKRRTNRMLIGMVTIFGLSWLPLNLVNLANDIYIPTAEWQYYTFFFFMAHAIAMSSTCYNPFLYAWLNENFRKEFKQVLPCFEPSPTTNRFGNWRSERTCNGNETLQDSLLTTHSSLRTTITHTASSPQEERIPAASYSANQDIVHLHWADGKTKKEEMPEIPEVPGEMV